MLVLFFPAKPDLYIFSTGAKGSTNVVLTCMATGFSSTNTVLQIKLDGRVLTREDGVQSSEVLPNGDGTFQKTETVEILKSDNGDYTCEVIHPSSSLHVVKVWGKNLCLLFNTRTHVHTILHNPDYPEICGKTPFVFQRWGCIRQIQTKGITKGKKNLDSFNIFTSQHCQKITENLFKRNQKQSKTFSTLTL